MSYLYKRLEFYRILYGSIQIEGHCDWPNPDTGYRKTCPGKLFPLKEVKNKFVQHHWAIENYNYYNEYIGNMTTTDLDAPLTTGMYVTLRRREEERKANELVKK